MLVFASLEEYTGIREGDQRHGAAAVQDQYGWGSYVWRETADQCLQNHEYKRQFMHSWCSHTTSSGSLIKVVEDQMKRDKGRHSVT